MLVIHSCQTNENNAVVSLKQSIDSLNSEYAQGRQITSESLDVLQKMIDRGDSLGYAKGIIESSIILYQFYFAESNFPEAYEMLIKAEDNLSQADNPFLAGRVYFYLGQFQERINNDDIALTYLLKSAESFMQAGDIGRLAKVYRQIGNIGYDNQDWALARKYRWLAYQTHLQANDSPELIKDLSNISIFYTGIGKNDSAEIILNKAFQVSESLKEPRDRVQFLINVASRALENEEYETAEAMLSQATDITDSLINRKDFTYLAPFIYVNLGLVQKNKRDFDSAKNLFEKSLTMAGPNVNLTTRAGITYELYQSYIALKNYDEASKYMERYQVLMDSNNREINRQNLMALEMKYNFEKSEVERIGKLKRQKLFLTWSGIAIGLIMFSLILLYSRQRIKTKNIRLQKKIQDINLERLNRELASHALNMLRMNERKVSLITTLKQQLPTIKKENQQILQNVIAGFESDQNESAWREFELRFREVHKEFYDKLMAINPNLTLNEKRLCAFLLLDMTSKEISAITGQSVRAIEQARIRLRKQLGLTNQSVSLTQFLSSL